MKQCKQVWNKDREESQWHTQWDCENAECVAPRCQDFRAHGFATARDARIDAIKVRLDAKLSAANEEYAAAMARFRAPGTTAGQAD